MYAYIEFVEEGCYTAFQHVSTALHNVLCVCCYLWPAYHLSSPLFFYQTASTRQIDYSLFLFASLDYNVMRVINSPRLIMCLRNINFKNLAAVFLKLLFSLNLHLYSNVLFIISSLSFCRTISLSSQVFFICDYKINYNVCL